MKRDMINLIPSPGSSEEFGEEASEAPERAAVEKTVVAAKAPVTPVASCKPYKGSCRVGVVELGEGRKRLCRFPQDSACPQNRPYKTPN